MNKTYRIELVYDNGQKIIWGYTSATIVNVYAKTGKKVIASYQG